MVDIKAHYTDTNMTHIISSVSKHKKITIDPQINEQIKALHRQLVALSFAQGSQSMAYRKTLEQIHQLRQSESM